MKNKISALSTLYTIATGLTLAGALLFIQNEQQNQAPKTTNAIQLADCFMAAHNEAPQRSDEQKKISMRDCANSVLQKADPSIIAPAADSTAFGFFMNEHFDRNAFLRRLDETYQP